MKWEDGDRVRILNHTDKAYVGQEGEIIYVSRTDGSVTIRLDFGEGKNTVYCCKKCLERIPDD